jgi:hypothetical protein
MCSRKDCKYVELIIDSRNDIKYYIHYKYFKRRNAFILKELYRQSVELSDDDRAHCGIVVKLGV